MKSSEEIYATVTKWLLYAAFILMATVLIIRILIEPEKTLTQVGQVVAGEAVKWHPEQPHDWWALYAIGFANTIVAIGVLAAWPALKRESKAIAIVAAFVLLLFVIAALGLVSVKI